jgi:hypothetical protein
VPDASGPFFERRLEADLEQLRSRAQGPAGLDKAQPILAELDTIAVVLSSLKQTRPSLEVEEISLLSGSIPSLTVSVADTETAEELLGSLEAIGGSAVEWQSGIFERAGQSDRMTYKITGIWRTGAGRGGNP